MEYHDYVTTCLNDEFKKDHYCENCIYCKNTDEPCVNCIHDQAIGDYVGKSYWTSFIEKKEEIDPITMNEQNKELHEINKSLRTIADILKKILLSEGGLW